MTCPENRGSGAGDRPVAGRAPPPNRAGTSLVELILAVAILGVGIAGVASLTAAAARTLVRAKALDETHILLQSFVDSAVAAAAPSAGRGRRVHPSGVLEWNVPSVPGSDAWVRFEFEHEARAEAIRIDFVVPAHPASPGSGPVP